MTFTWFLLMGLLWSLQNAVEGWVCFSSPLEGLCPSLLATPFYRNFPNFLGFQASFPFPQEVRGPQTARLGLQSWWSSCPCLGTPTGLV